MWLVLLGRTIHDDNSPRVFYVQFRKARDARRFAQALALVLMRHVLRPWKVAVYRVQPDCWPDDFGSPIVQWSCQWVNQLFPWKKRCRIPYGCTWLKQSEYCCLNVNARPLGSKCFLFWTFNKSKTIYTTPLLECSRAPGASLRDAAEVRRSYDCSSFMFFRNLSSWSQPHFLFTAFPPK